jgi:2-iminobutanoate/2-iminopropanoate deaminase
VVKKIISTSAAPQAMGAYSQGILVGNLLFLSGQIPLDPVTGHMLIGDITTQTRRVMANIGALLRSQDMDFSSIVKVTVYLVNIEHFGEFDRAYSGYFPGDPPARSCVQVSALPKGAFVEIDAIAAMDSSK